MNPIFRREFFVRWRDWRSHLLLLFLALLLGVSAYWTYWSALAYHPETARTIYNPATRMMVAPTPETLATRAARSGHALFQTLTIGNVVVLFVLAPLLTATSVVRERERGLLESLQLSHMSSRSQVVARAMSALFYLGALQLVTLPVAFIAFSFGSVSLPDIARAWMLAGATAVCGVGLGLMISSQAARPSGALFGTIALVFVWSVAAIVGLSGAASPWGLLGLGPGTLNLCQWLFYSHPVALATQMSDSLTLRAPPAFFGGPLTVAPVYWTASQALPFALLGYTLVGTLGLFKASRDVTRAFAPAGWAGRNRLVEKWKRRREERLGAQRERSSARVEGALLADLPIDKWIRFKNPLLNREVKGRFRLRRASVPVWAARTAIFLFAVSAWVMEATSVFDPVGRLGAAINLLWIEWILGVVLVATFAAAGFARERESGTWEGVRLSLLSNGQIARTKWLSPLIAFALLTCPLWLLLPLFLPLGGWNGVPFRVLFGGALAVASSVALVCALASWVSLRARNTTTATCWTLGILLALFVAAPIAWQWGEASDRIAVALVGVPPLSSDGIHSSNYYGYDPVANPEYVAQYEEQTGRRLHIPNVSAPSLGPPSPPALPPSRATPEEIERFQDWFKTRQTEASRVAALWSVWNPLFVLDALSKNNTSGEGHDLSNDDHALLALWHAGLCALAVLFLVSSVSRRLKKQRA